MTTGKSSQLDTKTGDNASPISKQCAESAVESSETGSRRDYFRVSTEVLLDITPAQPDHQNQDSLKDYFSDSQHDELQFALQQIDQSNAQLLKQIAGRDTSVANYLKGLNKKVELISQYLYKLDSNVTIQSQDQQRIAQVEFSESGISFLSESPYNENDSLAIKLVFMPHYQQIKTFINVRQCQRVEGQNHYRLAATFNYLSVQQRQFISQQVMRVQLAERRSISSSKSLS